MAKLETGRMKRRAGQRMTVVFKRTLTWGDLAAEFDVMQGNLCLYAGGSRLLQAGGSQTLRTSEQWTTVIYILVW